MSHRVRKFGTKKSKYEKFWIRTWKCLSVKLKLWTNAEVFISAPIKSSFPPAESAAGSSFCFCCSLIKKGLMRDLFTSYHSPSLAPPASLPLLAFPRCVTFECHGWRTETDVCSAARLSISLCLHDCDSHRLLPTSRKTSRLFILPLLLLLRLIGTAVRAVEGSACKAAALARAAR